MRCENSTTLPWPFAQRWGTHMETVFDPHLLALIIRAMSSAA
jgi:hypothetical protein